MPLTNANNEIKQLPRHQYIVLTVINQFTLMNKIGTEATQSGRANLTQPTTYGPIFRFFISDTKIIL